MILYLLLTITSTAIHFVWISGAMKKIPQIRSTTMMGASHVLSALLIFPWVVDDLGLITFTDALIYNILGFGLCMFVARMLYYYAFSKAEVGEVSMFASITPIYTLLIAPLFGYSITYMEVVGILLVSGSVYMYFLDRNTPLTLGYFFRPFRKVLSSKPLFCVFLSTLPPAFASIFQKAAIHDSSPIVVSFALCVIIGTLGVITSLFWKPESGRTVPRVANSWMVVKVIVIAGMLQAAMIVSGSYLLELVHPASMQALIRLAIPLQILLAFIFLKEATHIYYKLLLSLVTVIGGYLVLHATM